MLKELAREKLRLPAVKSARFSASRAVLMTFCSPALRAGIRFAAWRNDTKESRREDTKMEDINARPCAQVEEQEIDLKDLFLYMARKWRVLIVLGIIGVLLGTGLGLLAPEPSLEDFDMDELNLEQIEQYARYQELYEEQLAYEQESVYLNIDPHEAYSGRVLYYLRVREQDCTLVSQMYGTLLLNDAMYNELIEASGLNCSLRAIRELVSIQCSQLDAKKEFSLFDSEPLTLRLTLSVVAPTEESGHAMLDLVDEYAQKMNQSIGASYGVELLERLAYPCEQADYYSAIADARNDLAKTLGEYLTQITTLETKLSKDDLSYYSLTHPSEEEEKEGGKGWLKLAVIGGFLAVVIWAVVFGFRYLLDCHVKTLDELLAHGLHPVAMLEEKQTGRKPNALDKLFTVKHRYHSQAYLAEALGMLAKDGIVLVGDMNDPDVAALAQETVQLNDKLSAGMLMTVDADTQVAAQKADGAVLLVHLWKTRRVDFEQEIRIANKLGIRLLGVAVIG